MAMLLLATTALLRSASPGQTSRSGVRLSDLLAREVVNINYDSSHPETGQYASRRALDLLVLFRINNPSVTPSILVNNNTVIHLRAYRDALPAKSEPIVSGTIAALLGEYANATQWFMTPGDPAGSLCGNVAAALDFVGLPHFGGHYLKGGYDVQNADQISG
jgi:hypothetical protein